jgi:hypothetical protein
MLKLLIVSALVALAPCKTLAQQFTGQINNAWSAAADRCVPDVAGRFNAMRARGDDLAFNLGTVARGQKTELFGLINGAHWQGIQRLKGGNGQYLAVSQSYDANGRGGVAIVQMASRNATNDRFRSNRLSFSTIQVTPPPTTDRGINYFQSSSQATGNIYAHAGGMQAYGSYLAVPAETKISGSNAANSELLFYDVTNPAAPIQLPYSISRADDKAGTTALVRVADGRYIALVEGGGKLDFYVSSTTSLSDPATQFTKFASWTKGAQGLQVGSVDQNFGNYQAYNFIVQCDGKIFMTASANSATLTAGVISGEDWLDLYEVTLVNGNPAVALRKATNKHLYCADAAARTCNFAAAGGAYVTLAGDLIYYSTEHFNDGPSASVSFSEFVTEPTTCPTVNDAWIEIFDDRAFSDRTIFVDYADRTLRRYDNYNSLEGFNDKASSVRYCLPAGSTYRLYKDNTYRGGIFNLTGTGAVGSVIDLGAVGFGDTLSSSQFVP